jgi:hypothetical protein
MSFAGVFQVPVIFSVKQSVVDIGERQTTNSHESIAVKVAYGFAVFVWMAMFLLSIRPPKKRLPKRREGPFGGSYPYRMGAHSSSADPRLYRDDNEVEDGGAGSCQSILELPSATRILE